MEKAIEVLTQDLERIQKSLTEWNTQVEAFSIKLKIAQEAVELHKQTIEEIKDAIVQLALTN
jgi:chromosome segregation ATPase